MVGHDGAGVTRVAVLDHGFTDRSRRLFIKVANVTVRGLNGFATLVQFAQLCKELQIRAGLKELVDPRGSFGSHQP